MRCFSLLVHGTLDWSPDAVAKWEIPETRPTDLYCRTYTFARSTKEASVKVLAETRSYYEETTDWFINDLLEMHLTVEEIKSAPFYKGMFKGKTERTFCYLS